MRAIIGAMGAICGVLFFPMIVLGDSLYVKCFRQVALRAQASSDSREIGTLKPGQVATLVGEEGEFYQVTLPSGTKGYVRKAFMTNQAPAETRVEEVEQKLVALEAQTQAQKQELVTLRAQQQELLTLRAKNAQLEAAQKDVETTASRQAELAAQLQARQSTLERDKRLSWFMAGAGVLLSGGVLGWMWGAARSRSRSGRLRM